METLDHPNILGLIGTYYIDENLWLVIELMEGDLFDIQIPLDEPNLANVAAQLLSGLAYMQREHVIHREIKPENILYNREGVAKFTVFGLAKVMEY